MLNAIIQVSSIDYEKSISVLLPKVVAHLQQESKPNTLIRLFQKLGDASIELTCGILRYVPVDVKTQLICTLIDQYREVILHKINKALSTNALGKNFQIGDICTQKTDNNLLIFTAYRVAIDYTGVIDMLANEKAGKWGGLLRVARNVVSHSHTETLALEALAVPRLHAALCRLLQNALARGGVFVEISDVRIQKETERWATISPHVFAEQHTNFVLSSELEDHLLQALVLYLRDHA